MKLLQNKIKKHLHQLGFSLVSFAQPPLGQAGEHFQNWLKQNYHGRMGYLSRRAEERLHPQQLLPKLRSIIVLAYPYDTGLKNTQKPNEGNISRYAWGKDYHEVLKEKLKSFETWLKSQQENILCCSSVDAEPVLEKAWAQKAGLGWMGKHTNMIHPKQGSYFFLATLLTNLEFEPDPLEPDRCGTCTRCIEVCPTRAIIAPYVLDARLCISYLTIELRQAIPRNLRPLIGNHVFGCDDCQEVCPWNRFSQSTSEAAFFPKPELRNQPLAKLLQMDRAEFRTKFQDSAISRAGYRGFIRNVLVAIGNSGEVGLAGLVHVKFQDPSPLIRAHAVWAYARLLGKQAQADLEKLKRREQDELVLEEIKATALFSP